MTHASHTAPVLTQPIIMYATPWCGDCRRAIRWFDTHGVRYEYVNIDQDAQAAAQVLRMNNGMRSVPTIVFPDGSVLVEPSVQELAQHVAVSGTSAGALESAAASTRNLQSEQYLWNRPASVQSDTDQVHRGRKIPMAKRAVMDSELYDMLPVGDISYPRFARFYNLLMGQAMLRLMFDPLRHATAGQAHGIVLEVGAGGGQNFPFYDPARVVRVEAIEPDPIMLVAAAQGQTAAPVPIRLSCATVEAIPFPDAFFDSAVVSLVFCSVREPRQGLSELWRILKPGGSIFFLEHVRAEQRLVAVIQDALVPLTTRCMGNCHWNRDTRQAIQDTGFEMLQVREVSGGLQPMLCLHVTRPVAS